VTEPPARGELRRLTSLRWFAALLVFLVHADGLLGWAPLRLFDFGGVGVAFFFVLSGFVLTWSARAGSVGSFYWRRFARIYPSMLAVLLAVAIAARLFVVPTYTGVGPFLASLFAVQAWLPSPYVFAYNGPAWSLSAEFFFYALFPLLLAWLSDMPIRRATVLVGGAVLAAAAVAVAMNETGHGLLAYTMPAIRVPEFAAGAVLGLAVRSGWRPRMPMWAAAGAVLASGVVAHETLHANTLAGYVMLPGFALLIVTAAVADIEDRSGWLPAGWLVYLGRVSFAFYLVHQFVMETFALHVHWQHQWSGTSSVWPLVVLFALALVCALLLHHVVERPAERWLRQHAAMNRRAAV
jgi:peptidoglycan/LPS O-acetylase OafA/YrhL